MAKVSLNTIKSWFQTAKKPTQGQFSDTFDSFYHKDEKLRTSDVERLDNILNNKLDTDQFDGHVNRKDNPHQVTADQIGLGNIQEQLDSKVSNDDSRLHSHDNLDVLDQIDEDDEGAPTWNGEPWPGSADLGEMDDYARVVMNGELVDPSNVVTSTKTELFNISNMWDQYTTLLVPIESLYNGYPFKLRLTKDNVEYVVDGTLNGQGSFGSMVEVITQDNLTLFIMIEINADSTVRIICYEYDDIINVSVYSSAENDEQTFVQKKTYANAGEFGHDAGRILVLSENGEFEAIDINQIAVVERGPLNNLEIANLDRNNYGISGAEYTKIGNVVFCKFRFRIYASQQGSTPVVIEGLPYYAGFEVDQFIDVSHSSLTNIDNITAVKGRINAQSNNMNLICEYVSQSVSQQNNLVFSQLGQGTYLNFNFKYHLD